MATAQVNVLNEGDVYRSSAFFTDPFSTPTPDDPIDPTSVFLKVLYPDGTIVQLQFGVDPITNPAVGEYVYDLDLDQGGDYCLYWFSTGTGQAAEQDNVHAIAECTAAP